MGKGAEVPSRQRAERTSINQIISDFDRDMETGAPNIVALIDDGAFFKQLLDSGAVARRE